MKRLARKKKTTPKFKGCPEKKNCINNLGLITKCLNGEIYVLVRNPYERHCHWERASKKN